MKNLATLFAFIQFHSRSYAPKLCLFLCRLILTLTSSLNLFSRCQWYFKAKMSPEEKRRTDYQNGQGKSICLFFSSQQITFICMVMMLQAYTETQKWTFIVKVSREMWKNVAFEQNDSDHHFPLSVCLFRPFALLPELFFPLFLKNLVT